MAAVVAGLKSGRMYGVFGDLIDALEFRRKAPRARRRWAQS